jgi:DNA-binding NarL/FixJ family response regulator
MSEAAPLPELSIRRIKHGVRHGQRRGRTSIAFGAANDEVWATHSRRSVLMALIDPKPLTREAILNMFGTSLPQHVRVIGVPSIAELIQLPTIDLKDETEAQLQLVILYIRSAGAKDNWVQDQLQQIRGWSPELPVVMISDRDDADDVINALNCGVRGYIPTSVAAEVAIAALTLIEAGGTYVPADALRQGQEAVESPSTPSNPEDDEHSCVPIELNLTSRELAVIDLLREGNANKLIALKLNMRESTVKVHVRNILKKLRVSNRTHAATVANRLLTHGVSMTALVTGDTSDRRH